MMWFIAKDDINKGWSWSYYVLRVSGSSYKALSCLQFRRLPSEPKLASSSSAFIILSGIESRGINAEVSEGFF